MPSDAAEAEGDVGDGLFWAALVWEGFWGADVGAPGCELAAGALMFVWRTLENLCDGAAAGAALAVGTGFGGVIISKIARAMNGAACA